MQDGRWQRGGNWGAGHRPSAGGTGEGEARRRAPAMGRRGAGGRCRRATANRRMVECRRVAANRRRVEVQEGGGEPAHGAGSGEA